MVTKELTGSQLGAIRYCIRRAKVLQIEHPEIVNMYKEKNQRQIAEELGLTESDGENGRAIVQIALSGHPGDFEGGIEGLITEECERKSLAKMHRARTLYENTGALSPDQRSEISRKAGEVGGAATHKNGTGFFGLSDEEKGAARRNGIIKSLEVQGKVLLKPAGFYVFYDKIGQEIAGIFASEEEQMFSFSREPKYQHRTGSNKGQANIQKIKAEINRIYHNGEEVRTDRSVRSTISRYKKKFLG